MMATTRLQWAAEANGEIGFEFLPGDTAGFPRRLAPARKIGLGRRVLSGLPWNQKFGADTYTHLEASLKRDFFVLLEFNNEVSGWDPQPVKIKVPGEHPFVPDVLVHWFGEDQNPITGDKTLYEVKYREDLKRRWEELRPRYRSAARFARRRGWKFRVVTEEHIRTPVLYNAKFLLPYLQDPPDERDTLQLLHAMEVMGETTPEELLAACSSDTWTRARLVTTLWRMVATRLVGADFSHPLNIKTAIWLND